MPLAAGSSQATISANVEEMIKAGHPPKQAEAAAYRMARGDAVGPTRAAGVMFLTAKGECLFLKRGPGSDHAGEWCFPGGHTEGNETPEQTAERETIEELGFLPEGKRAVWTRQITNNLPPPPPVIDGISGALPVALLEDLTPSVDYTTFIQRVPERFDPEVSGEHTGFAWSLPTEPPEPLHPGARIALARLTMNELDIARAMAAAELTSPQFYENVWLFDIRITGTGAAYRSGLKEHVWRDPSLYLTDDFLARCNGLAVIWIHPKGALNSEEYSDRSIGSVMLPYIKGDEVWAIAKVYDQGAAHEMASGELSTSPMVSFRDPTVNTKVKLEDGSNLLIEGDPGLLDHIAIVSNGVWDKGGEPSGIRADSAKESTMADETEAEKKAREDKEKSDASNIATVMGDAMKMMDGIAKRMDAMEMADKSRRDAEEEKERKSAQDRRDAEREPWMKADAAECARDDAEEEKEREEHEKKGETKEAAADKARKDRRDRMDKRRADAEKEKADADKARADAQPDIAKLIADAVKQHMPRDRSDTERAELADAQARADAAYRAFGDQASPPMQAELASDYRRRLLKPLQRHSKPWADIELRGVADSVLTVAEGQIYADAAIAARNTDDMPSGALIPIRTINPETNHVVTTFRGKGSFIGALKPDSMRVTKFKTNERGA